MQDPDIFDVCWTVRLNVLITPESWDIHKISISFLCVAPLLKHEISCNLTIFLLQNVTEAHSLVIFFIQLVPTVRFFISRYILPVLSLQVLQLGTNNGVKGGIVSQLLFFDSTLTKKVQISTN